MIPYDKQMFELFQGRLDAYGGDEGRAIYLPAEDRDIQWRRLIWDHLHGGPMIGVYPIRHTADPTLWDLMSDRERMDTMLVRWGCCDIDTGDWSECYRLAHTLQLMGLVPVVERSRSKGWHIWIFVSEWMPAWQMRRCLKVAYKAAGIQAKEANPKSELLRPSQLGNYVRLPYGFNRPEERQCVMEGWLSGDDGYSLTVAEFLDTTWNWYTDAARIVSWAKKWYEPPRLKIVVDAVTSEATQQVVDSLPKGLRKLFDNGPASDPQGHQDTSSGLMALAYNMAKRGFMPNDVMLVVAAADRRWGKYHLRLTPEAYYEDIVRRAYV